MKPIEVAMEEATGGMDMAVGYAYCMLTKVRNHSSAGSPNKQTSKPKKTNNDWGLYPSWKHILRGLRDYGKLRCPTGAAFHRVTRPTAAPLIIKKPGLQRGCQVRVRIAPVFLWEREPCGGGWIAIGVRTTGERWKAEGG